MSRQGLCWLGGGEHGEGCAHVVPVRLQISIEGKLLWSVIMVNIVVSSCGSIFALAT